MKSEYTKLIELLINSGADVNAKDNDGKTVLMYAFDAGLANILIDAGSNDIKNKHTENIILPATKKARKEQTERDKVLERISNFLKKEDTNGDPLKITEIPEREFLTIMHEPHIMTIFNISKSDIDEWIKKDKIPASYKTPSHGRKRYWKTIDVFEHCQDRKAIERLVKMCKGELKVFGNQNDYTKSRKKEPATKPSDSQKKIQDLFDAEIKNGDQFGIKDLDKVLFEIELDAEEVLEITELKRRATLYEWMNAGKFPRQKKLYSNHVGWNVLELWEWASNRPGNREKARLVKILKKF